MISNFKIPTLLGLTILTVGIGAGVFLVAYSQPTFWRAKASSSQTPKEVQVANISNTSASIYWQTDEAVPGFIQAGPTTFLGSTYRDDRDTNAPTHHKLHFVTLTNLNPQTTYYYKVTSGSTAYPSGSFLTFQTSSDISSSNLPPLRGNIITTASNPAAEAFVTLKISGAQTLATITKVAGSFILPLAHIYKQDLTSQFNTLPAVATLEITDLANRSQVIIPFPYRQEELPTITLGQNLDLTVKDSSPTPSLSRFDLNGDRVVNSLDVAIVRKNIGKNPPDKKADLNNDTIVNTQDLAIISQESTRHSN